MRRVSTTNSSNANNYSPVAFPSPSAFHTPVTASPSSAAASPLHRATFHRPRPASSAAHKRYSLPTALNSPRSPFASSFEGDGTAGGVGGPGSSSDLGDDVESSFWTSQHPLSSCAEPLDEEEDAPSEPQTADDEFVTESPTWTPM